MICVAKPPSLWDAIEGVLTLKGLFLLKHPFGARALVRALAPTGVIRESTQRALALFTPFHSVDRGCWGSFC
jgi:hypothetical protein